MVTVWPYFSCSANDETRLVNGFEVRSRTDCCFTYLYCFFRSSNI